MADYLNPQDLANAKVDAKTLGEALNDEKVVKPRYGKSYDSFPLLVRKLLDNGGFRPFPNEQAIKGYVPTVTPSVAKDMATYKLWLWDKGAWTDTGLSELDRAKEYTDTWVVLTGSDLKAGTDVSGSSQDTQAIYKSDPILIPFDSKVRWTKTSNLWHVGVAFSESEKFSGAISWYAENERTVENKDGISNYVKFYFRKSNNGVITSDDFERSKLKLFVENTDILHNDLHIKKYNASLKKSFVSALDFNFGDDNQAHVETQKVVKTGNYAFPERTVLQINRKTHHSFWWSYATSHRPDQFKRKMPWLLEQNKEIVMPVGDKFIRFYMRVAGGDINTAEIDVDLNRLHSTVFSVTSTADIEVLRKFSDFHKNQKYKTLIGADFIFGDNFSSAATRAMTKHAYKLPSGTIVTILAQADSPYNYNYGTGSDSNVNTQQKYYFAESRLTFTVTEDEPFVRFYIRRKEPGNITDDDLKNPIGIDFTIPDIELLNSDVVKYIDNIDTGSVDISLMDTSSTFRIPSLATGGVVSFIDDDGRNGAYTELFPVIKEHEIPYGIAVSPGLIDKKGYMTLEQLKEVNDFSTVEIQSHAWSHARLTEKDNETIRYQVAAAKNWFAINGFGVSSFVYPYGADNPETHKIVAQYYNCAFDFPAPETVGFKTIRNYLIKRAQLSRDGNFDTIKGLIDRAAQNNEWLIITTHAGNPEVTGGGTVVWWQGEKTVREVVELYNYAKEKGCKVVKPREGFQIFGNMIENDSGFRITATGEIVTA